MAGKGADARYTAAHGRRFALTVGAAFIAIGGVAWWRQQGVVAAALGALGGLLVLAGLVIPGWLGPVERAWMALAHLISKVTTPIVMGAMYLLVILPVGVLRRTFGGNPLAHEAQNGSYWRARAEPARRSNMERQF